MLDFSPMWNNNCLARRNMCNYQEKKNTFYRLGSRIMVVAHRADNNQCYPENSLEGTESVLQAGADIIETDIHVTIDGIPIVMHDPTLTRTTNADAYIGRDGFPTSSNIKDWRFDQIRQLRLRNIDGTIGQSLVPSLRDQIILCKDRAFLTLDKHNSFDWDMHIYPIICELGAYETVMVPYTYTPQRAHQIQLQMIKDSGTHSPYFRDSRNDQMLVRTIMELAKEELPPLLRGTEYRPEDDMIWEIRMNALRETHKYYIETLNPEHDQPIYWKRIIELGCGFIMGNRIYDLLDMISEMNPEDVYKEI